MEELNDSDIFQMIGRAGRPQFDDTGVAVILTRSDKRTKYENIVAGKDPLESRLQLQLAEHMNAEIGLGTISDVNTARKWLRSTFFYVRCRANPSFYGLNTETDGVENMIEQKCIEAIDTLRDAGLVDTTEGRLNTTPYGEAAAKYCLRMSTIKHIIGMDNQAQLKQVVPLYAPSHLSTSWKRSARQKSSMQFTSDKEKKGSTTSSSTRTMRFVIRSSQGRKGHK
jgi:ATP-dependent DNA helicase HFM1/MER3